MNRGSERDAGPRRVARPRLVTRLSEAVAAHPLTLVAAPAGWGKTTLLEQWSEQPPMSVAMARVQPASREPSRYLGLLAQSLDRLEPRLLEPPASASLQGTPPHELLALLLRSVAKSSRPLVLVIDDYHHVSGDGIDRLTQRLVESAPASLRVVMSTRAEPRLPLAVWRACGKLAELGGAELAFSLDDSSRFLGTTMGLRLSAAEVEGLHARTEGWAAGLQLAALALRQGSEVASVVARFSGGHRFVFDYLAAEVLDRQPPGRRRALEELSILGRMSQGLVRAVLSERADIQELRELERANLFLVPLDPERRWYRFHHLFADFLRARLQSSATPAERRELHLRASRWLESRGEIEDAFEHALAADEPERAADVLERTAAELSRRSEAYSTLERLLSMLPDECVRPRPRLCLETAWSHLMRADPEPIETYLGWALRGAERLEESQRRDVVGTAAAIRAMLASLGGDLRGARRSAREALSYLPPGTLQWRATVHLALGAAELMRGDLHRAANHLQRGERLCLAYDDVAKAVFAVVFQARVQWRLGRLGGAETAWRRGIDLSQPLAAYQGTILTAPSGLCHAGLAELHYERGEFAEARRAALQALRLAAHWGERGLPEAIATANLVLACLQQARGGERGARRFLERAEQTFDELRLGDFPTRLATLRVKLWLAQGEIGAATAWAAQLGWDVCSAPDAALDPETAIALLRIELACHQPGTDRWRALRRALDLWREEAEIRRCRAAVVELLALSALVAQADGDLEAAEKLLLEALARAAAEEYVRVFADEGTPMAQLVLRLVNGLRRRHRDLEAVPSPYLSKVMRSLGLAPRPDREAVPRPVVAPRLVPLTPREVEVLALLKRGLSKREIGDRLNVSLGTVKRHVSNIGAKLGTRGRGATIARARQLRVI